MHAAGWVGISWPREHGGRGVTLRGRVICDDGCCRARAPVLPGYSGINMAGPTLIEWGTDAQKRRFLPRILAGDDIWCQATPSRARARTSPASRRARRIGATSSSSTGRRLDLGAQFAAWIYLLVRTDPKAPKHRGISYLLVDMKAGHHGASARAHERPPALQRGVLRGRGGAEGQPRRPGARGLEARDDDSYVRAQGRGRARPRREIARLGALARDVTIDGAPAWERATIRQQFAQLAIEATCLRYTRLRNLTRQLRVRAAGPEGSILKLFGSELGRADRRLRGRPARAPRAREPPERGGAETRRAGTTASSARASTRSRGAPARSSATSSASASSVCPRTEGGARD